MGVIFYICVVPIELILSLLLLMSLLVRDVSTAAWIFSALYGCSCTWLIVPLPVVQMGWFVLFLPMAFEGNMYKDTSVFVV